MLDLRNTSDIYGQVFTKSDSQEARSSKVQARKAQQPVSQRSHSGKLASDQCRLTSEKVTRLNLGLYLNF